MIPIIAISDNEDFISKWNMIHTFPLRWTTSSKNIIICRPKLTFQLFCEHTSSTREWWSSLSRLRWHQFVHQPSLLFNGPRSSNTWYSYWWSNDAGRARGEPLAHYNSSDPAQTEKETLGSHPLLQCPAVTVLYLSVL